VHPSGEVEEVPFPQYTNYGHSALVNHVPNPRTILRYARECGFELDEIAFETIVGRWKREMPESYPDGTSDTISFLA